MALRPPCHEQERRIQHSSVKTISPSGYPLRFLTNSELVPIKAMRPEQVSIQEHFPIADTLSLTITQHREFYGF